MHLYLSDFMYLQCSINRFNMTNLRCRTFLSKRNFFTKWKSLRTSLYSYGH